MNKDTLTALAKAENINPGGDTDRLLTELNEWLVSIFCQFGQVLGGNNE